MKRILAFLLCLLTLASFTGCDFVRRTLPKLRSVKAEDLMKDVTVRKTETATVDEDDFIACLANASFDLFRETVKDQNVMISPVSLAIALSMLANGTAGNTKTELESALLGGRAIEELNPNFADLIASLEGDTLHIADSVWIRNDPLLTVEEDFLRTVKTYYGADAYRSDFDEQTVRDINLWCAKQTDRMIPEILKELGKDDMIHLINAVSFDAKWESPYRDSAIRDGVFHAKGNDQPAKMMSSSEHRYLKDENAVGFVRYYEGNYAFVALLPDEDLSVTDYAKSLTGESFLAILKNSESAEVRAQMPQFSSEYTADMIPVMRALGVNDVFAYESADLSPMAKYDEPDANLIVSSIVHKTYIDVGAKGTRAAAITDIGIGKATSAGPAEDPYVVILDRPFLYAIIDTATNLPLFLGTVQSVG